MLAVEYSCDKYYVAQLEGGVIASDNYPFDYHNNRECKYKIYTGDLFPGQPVQICFQFLRFQTESIGNDCKDFLILNGEKYCGEGSSSSLNGTSVWSENWCTGI